LFIHNRNECENLASARDALGTTEGTTINDHYNHNEDEDGEGKGDEEDVEGKNKRNKRLIGGRECCIII
jgi:hypothetical protein